MRKATQEEYDNLATHIKIKWYENDSHFMEDCYYEARIILTMLGFDHKHLNEHLVREGSP